MDNVALREQIKQLVEKIKNIIELTPENVITLDTFLTASDEELPSIQAKLTQFIEEITVIENDTKVAEQKLLDQYMIELKEITNKAQRLALEADEITDRGSEQQKQEVMLQTLNQV